MKALLFVGFQPGWVIVPTSMEQVGGDLRHTTAIQDKRPTQLPRHTWTTLTTTAATPGHYNVAGSEDRPAVRANPS